MSLPKYNELYRPILSALSNGEMRSIKEIKADVASSLQISEEGLAERLPSGNQPIFDNRVGWARSYLKKAGLIEAPQRSYLQITEEGRKLYASGVTITNALLANSILLLLILSEKRRRKRKQLSQSKRRKRKHRRRRLNVFSNQSMISWRTIF